MSDDKFDRCELRAIDDLPDHYHQEIHDLAEKILANVCHDFKTNQVRDMNISLGAMQKAFALMLASYFKKAHIDEITDQCCVVLKANVKLWCKDDE